jgi:uncharacterized protein
LTSFRSAPSAPEKESGPSKSTPPVPPVETNRDRVGALAAQNGDDYEAFGYYIDLLWDREGHTDAELDALVESVASEVIAQINCTACADCCRPDDIGLMPHDIPPLAAVLGLPAEDVIAQFVDLEAGARAGEWGVFRGTPCPFLHGKRCSVYSHRPQACRGYPAFTPDFRWFYPQLVRSAGRCPISFNVIERLKARLGW